MCILYCFVLLNSVLFKPCLFLANMGWYNTFSVIKNYKRHYTSVMAKKYPIVCPVVLESNNTKHKERGGSWGIFDRAIFNI